MSKQQEQGRGEDFALCAPSEASFRDGHPCLFMSAPILSSHLSSTNLVIELQPISNSHDRQQQHIHAQQHIPRRRRGRRRRVVRLCLCHCSSRTSGQGGRGVPRWAGRGGVGRGGEGRERGRGREGAKEWCAWRRRRRRIDAYRIVVKRDEEEESLSPPFSLLLCPVLVSPRLASPFLPSHNQVQRAHSDSGSRSALPWPPLRDARCKTGRFRASPCACVYLQVPSRRCNPISDEFQLLDFEF